LSDPALYRYCPACDEEFRTGVERCSDCGGALEDRLEGGDAPPDGDDDPETDAATWIDVHVAERSAEAHVIARRLAREGIPYRVDAKGQGTFVLSVPEAAAPAAKAVLPREAAPDPDGFDVEKGYEQCPACGSADVAGRPECPECGLTLAGE
jgi:hypothetical protein